MKRVVTLIGLAVESVRPSAGELFYPFSLSPQPSISNVHGRDVALPEGDLAAQDGVELRQGLLHPRVHLGHHLLGFVQHVAVML